jgi:hypothetical protein
LYTHGGQDFTFGIDRTGSFYAWGDNEFGQLGLNSTSHYSSSIRISTSSVRQLTSSLFGWSFNVGDPFNSGIKQNSVQLINEEGAYLDFATYPPLLDLTFKGSSSRLYVESESGSILWDGKKIVVTGVEISSSVIVGSLLTGSLPDGVVSGSPQTLEHLYGTNIVSSSEQRFVLGLAETDSPRFSGLTIDGDLTARQYIVSSSVYIVTQSFSDGSTIFGNDTNDNHEFTGSLRVLGNTHEITGSVYTLGDVHIDGDLYADILISTASYAIFAETASILLGTGTGSFSGSFTGSFDATGSFTGSHFGSASLSGSFDGIFFGQGSGSFSGSFDATGSFTGSHFGSASLSGSFDGIFFGQGSGSFSGSHFGSASLSGSFDGTFSGQGSGSFSGSHFGSASLSGSFDGIFFGQGSGSFSGSHYGDFYGLAGSINGNFTGSFSGSFTGSFDATGSFTGSHFGYHEGTASLSGSFTGSLSGTASYAETASYLLGYGIGQFTGSFSGSFTGSFDATGSFSGSHFGSASLSGSFDGIFFGQGSGSFSGSHFGSASLSGSFDGIFFGQGSGSFSGSHFGSASLSGSFDGIFRGQGSGSFSGSHFGSASLSGSFSGSHFGFLNDVHSFRQDVFMNGSNTSSVVTTIPGAGSPTNIRQNQDITFYGLRVAKPFTFFSGALFSNTVDNFFGVGTFYENEVYHKTIQIGRSPILTQSILLNADTKVHAGATLTTQRLVVTASGNDWPFGTEIGENQLSGTSPVGLPGNFRNALAIIDGLQATGSMRGTFTGSLRGGSFTGSATGSFYASASIGNMQRFVGIGSSSFIGVSNPGTASFIGLVSSASYTMVYTSSGTYTVNVPTWSQYVTVVAIGGGGAGGNGIFSTDSTQYRFGGSGGGGADCVYQKLHISTFSSALTIQVGTSGSRRVINSAVFPNGGDTKVKIGVNSLNQDIFLVAKGGYAGNNGTLQPTTNLVGINGAPPHNSYYWSTGGGPGARASATISSGTSPGNDTNATPLPLAPDVNHNGSSNKTAAVAPTGGGAGGVIANNSTTVSSGGTGGGFTTNRQTTNGSQQALGFVNLVRNYTNDSTPQRVNWNGIILGLGGRGGGSNGTAVKGGDFGGGGGGGRALHATTDPNNQTTGSDGGAGAVILIFEA